MKMSEATAQHVEEFVQNCLREFRRKGEADKALRWYGHYQKGRPFTQALTHYLAYVAAYDSGAPDEALDAIYARASQCSDIERLRLNFDRAIAIRLARSDGKHAEAMSTIQRIIDERSEPGQDPTELLGDELAACQVLLFGGGTHEAMKRLFSLLTSRELQGITRREAEWWYFVSCLLQKIDGTAVALARKSLKSGRDENSKRKQAWQWCLRTKFGPGWARMIVQQQLGQ